MGITEYQQKTWGYWAQFEEDKSAPPLFRKQVIDCSVTDFIPCDKIKATETDQNKKKIVHFYACDNKLDFYYTQREKYPEKLRQYYAVCSPDYSAYIGMHFVEQNFNILRNRRICGYWERSGLLVIPTMAWAGPETYDMAFCNIEPGCVVTISALNFNDNPEIYCNGFKEMMERVKPSNIYCYARIPEQLYEFADKEIFIHIPYRKETWKEASDQNKLDAQIELM